MSNLTDDDTFLRATLTTPMTAAVQDTGVPARLCHDALAGGRSRRRRRNLAGMALATAGIVAGAVVSTSLPPRGEAPNPASAGDPVADDDGESMTWARSLPQGDAPKLPFFGQDAALWSGGTAYQVPEQVNRAFAPVEVEGGWLVVTGEQEQDLARAVLSPEGTLRALPQESTSGLGDSRVVVSPAGDKAAYGERVVDLDTMTATPAPHAPQRRSEGGFGTWIRWIGFDGQDVLYEGAPYTEGIGTTWRLQPDGTSEKTTLPPDSHVPQDGPADAALSFDYAADESDTCVTTWLLHDTSWEEWKSACMGEGLGEALAVSPGKDWLLTDDLPRVWSLADGEWDTVDVPEDIARRWRQEWMARAVWEDEDSLLLPVVERDADATGGADGADGNAYGEQVQVVRCELPTGGCERAGAEQDVEVEQNSMGVTDVKFSSAATTG